MKPTKNKTYFIGYKGYFDYDGYIGKAKCLNSKPNKDGNFEFELLDPIKFESQKTAFFGEEEIITEIKND